MTLPEADKIPGKAVITIFFIKLFALTERIYNAIECRNVQSTLFHKLIAFLESRGEFYLIH